MTSRGTSGVIAVLLLCIANVVTGQPALPEHNPDDADRDGLSDRLEQELLDRFVPSFFISANDCDVMPAEFAPGFPEPRLVARNGTIYGQVFQRPWSARQGRFIEIHYFHLWARDCGRAGHPLDAEHVSVLLRADRDDSPAMEWSAVYWYAGAHEDTVCDVSSASNASELGAVDRGPKVWISNGKHASFLFQQQYAPGCGGDRFENMVEVKVGRIVNLGEIDAPLNGAVWVTSKHWKLSAKLATNFDDRVLAQLSNPAASTVPKRRAQRSSARAVIRSSASTLDSVEGSRRAAVTAFDQSERNADLAIEGSVASVKAPLSRAASAVSKSVHRSVGSAARFVGLQRK